MSTNHSIPNNFSKFDGSGFGKGKYDVADESKVQMKQEEDPHDLPVYDLRFFKKIDWRALPTDLTMIVFGIILSRGYFQAGHVIESLSPKALLLFFMVVVVAVCWYLGFMLARYKVYYSKFISQTARVIFSIAGIALLGYLMAIINPLILENAHPDPEGEHLAMFSIFLLVLGPFVGIGGYMTGMQLIRCETKGVAYEGGSDEMYYGVIFALLLSSWFLVRMSQTDLITHSSVSFLWFILIFIGAGFVGAIGIGLLMMIKNVLKFIGLYYRLAFVFETIFPCLIIASLIFWNEVQRHFLIGISPGWQIGILVLTGIIPFRFILIFNPPLRGINLLIGIVAFVFYLWCIVN